MDHDGLKHFESQKDSAVTKRTYRDGSQNHATVRMLELRNNTLAYMLAFLFIDGIISSQRVQYGNPSPLRALVEGNEEFLKDRGIDGEDTFFGSGGNGCEVNIGKSSNRVCDDLGGNS